MMLHHLISALLVLGAAGAPLPRTVAPCVRLQRANTKVTGDVKICPGRYRITDKSERGVIVIGGSGTRVDLTGVTLESGDSVPADFVGVGIVSRGMDSVSIRGGRIRGFRYGIRLEGGRGHRISGIDLSGSRRQRLASTDSVYAESDWLDIFHPDTFETYGAGLYLKHTDGAFVTGVIARNAQNGIGLFGSRGATLTDNDVSGNSGWGIHLWASSNNAILRNRAHHNVRCEGKRYSRGCDSAALLLREQSDSNLIAENDLSHSGNGFFLSGHRPLVRPSIGNLVLRNDASFAAHNAFESTFSEWNTFLDNRADSSAYGFWLGYSRSNSVRGNSIVGAREAAIAIEHGGENELGGNVIIGGKVGIHVFAPDSAGDPSLGYRIDDNTIAKVERGIVLERTPRSRVRGNLFDGVRDALVVDRASGDAVVVGNVFLNALRYFIDAPKLEAGGNFWAAPSAEALTSKLHGDISVQPFRRAIEAGY